MNRVESARLVAFAAVAALSACSGSGTPVGVIKPGSAFVLVKTEPVNNGRIFLNDPIVFDFTNRIDLDSASLDTVTFQALDQLGNPVSELVSGTFQIGTTTGDDTPGRRLLFVPHFATNNTYDNGGFHSGRTYLVHLVGGSSYNGTALRDEGGKALEAPATFAFATIDGTLPAQLYRNPIAGGPRRIPVGGLTVSTATDLQQVPLNLYGAPPVEVRLHFDQALNPHDANVPVNFDSNPLVRSITNRGRIYLEYDDPVFGNNTWIPADVELERNDINGATVSLRPVGVLPNNAEIRVIVLATVEDISGESNVANLAYSQVFGTFRTARAYAQQFNAIVDSFTTSDNIDFGAPFPEPLADVGPGYLKAGFSFEGNQTSLEYEPTVAEVVLNTAFTQIVPRNGLPFNVSGGVFNFRNVRIPQGVSVRGQGPNPMVWLCSGDFKVEGTLSVNGGAGARVDTLNSANFAKGGGPGACGGGNGGDGTPSATLRDLRGATGKGPLQVPGMGGGGGRLACLSGCYTGSGYASSGGGSGGGGGTLATQGDPNFDQTTTTGTAFQQKRGIGGAGCSGTSGQTTGSGARVLLGGEAAPLVFTDARADNNFWGSGINLATNLRITGELSVPIGGGGGGGGGDTSHNFNCNANDPSFANDYSGGGGGGGAGVLIVKALGTIEVTPTGKIQADGGHGGGGEQVGACGEAGGGGAGAGGMVVLMSATKIKIHAHQTSGRYTFRGDTTHANNNNTNKDYNFAVSADGGICTTGSFQSPVIYSKYPAAGATVVAGSSYDDLPLGALGGMGIVQLMTPPGDNSDGTNTVLDDNIEIFFPTTPPAGVTKKTMLGWRGFPDAAGVHRDDFGVAIPVQTLTTAGTFGEGDIRPAPTLLPVPFNAKSRLRSKWLDTGLSKRRPLPADDGLPRGLVVGGNSAVGPIYEFAGLDLTTNEPGYVHYEPVGSSSVKILYPAIGSPIDVTGVNAAASLLGAPAYSIDLAAGSMLGTVPNDRYSQYEAELLNAQATTIGSFRILAHTAERIWLAPDANALPNGVVKVQVRAKFFKVVTNGSEGLGPVYTPTGGQAIPNANVRLGFAFHRDPAAGPAGRYPLDPKVFVYDMNDAGLQAWIAANGEPRYVLWDATFDMVYERSGSVAPSLNPQSPRPELHFLRIPFRF